MNLRFSPTALACLLALTSLPALADAPRYNQLSLRAEVSREVAHDRLYVTLYSEAMHKDPKRLAEQITLSLNQAISQARAVEAIQVQLGNRRSEPIYDDKGQQITGWRERAELRLESADFAALAQLSSELLGSLKMAGMQFALAEATRKTSEDELIREVLQAFRARAQLASEALGGSNYRLVSLSLNGGGFGHPPMLQMAMPMADGRLAKSAPVPQLEGGSSRVSLSADGVIEVIGTR